MLHSRRVSPLENIDSPGTPASDALRSRTDVPAESPNGTAPGHIGGFRMTFSLKAADPDGRRSAMRNHRTENAVCLVKKKTWKFVFLTVLAAGCLLLGKAATCCREMRSRIPAG